MTWEHIDIKDEEYTTGGTDRSTEINKLVEQIAILQQDLAREMSSYAVMTGETRATRDKVKVAIAEIESELNQATLQLESLIGGPIQLSYLPNEEMAVPLSLAQNESGGTNANSVTIEPSISYGKFGGASPTETTLDKLMNWIFGR